MMIINPNSKFYRLATIWNSFKAIYQLSPQEVNAFLEAYEIYNCEWINGQAMNESQIIGYDDVKQKLIDWYSVINLLCSIGQVEKMYIPPTLDLSKNVINNQILFERQFCQLLGMKADDKVFELGCGKGRVAAHLASLTGAEITGINIDQHQLDSAIDFAKKNNLMRCKFINADLNNLPFDFADNYFDCIYEIQALSLSRNLDQLFHELHRILKPGGKLSLLEWVRLPSYDDQNPHHLELMKQIKPLIGAIGTPSPDEYESELRNAGFEVLLSEDPSINKSQGPLIAQAGSNYNKLFPFVKFLVKLNLLPEHFILLLERLSKNVESLCEADRLGLVTTSYHLIAQKKTSSKPPD